jgi:peptidoglycan/xylan/chitin deacetylase (PgdA/CDA1 family)
MFKKIVFYFIPLALILCLGAVLHGQSKSTAVISSLVSYNLNPLNQISICRWKGDATACLNMSFDDNCASHNRISKIFDQYGYKATFFVIAQGILVDSIKDMFARGHEIGNHTYSHSVPFSQDDSTTIDFEIKGGKERIENILGVKCLSFTAPYHSNTSLSQQLVFNYHLFDRDYSEYEIYNGFELVSSTTIDQLSAYIKSGIKSRSMTLIHGHGIDGDGYQPISSNLLIQLLDIVKNNVDAGDIWITTLKDGEFYDDLYHEVSLDKQMNGDTLTLLVKNYNKEKYRDVDAAPISINIPTSVSSTIKCLTKNVDVKQLTNEFVLTMDLKRDTSLVVVLSSDLTPVDSINAEKLIIYPNPVSDILYLNTFDKILFTEIFDLQGNLIFRGNTNQSKIDVSGLPSGLYVIKVNTSQNGLTVFLRNKFIKK